MRWPMTHRMLVLALLLGGAALLWPLSAEGQSGNWLDQLTKLVLEHRDFAKFEGRETAYDPYLAQLEVARKALSRDDTESVYAAMNQFMTMLEHHPEGAGIATWSARMLFDLCGKVTPPMYHDVSRHAHGKHVRGFHRWDLRSADRRTD